jgi:hypothetical protein
MPEKDTWGWLFQQARNKMHDDSAYVLPDGFDLSDRLEIMHGPRFLAWSERYVYFPVYLFDENDGVIIRAVPRHPPIK